MFLSRSIGPSFGQDSSSLRQKPVKRTDEVDVRPTAPSSPAVRLQEAAHLEITHCGRRSVPHVDGSLGRGQVGQRNRSGGLWKLHHLPSSSRGRRRPGWPKIAPHSPVLSGRRPDSCLRRRDVPNRRPMHGIREGLRRSARRSTGKPRPADRKTPDDRPAKSDARVPPDGNVFDRSKRSPCPQVSRRTFRSTAITAKADGDRLGPRFRSAFLAAKMASRTIWTGSRVCMVNSMRTLQIPDWRLSHTTARSCE